MTDAAAPPLATVKSMSDGLSFAELAELQEYIAQKTTASPTAASKVSHVTTAGAGREAPLRH
jgi:hypothetical protein